MDSVKYIKGDATYPEKVLEALFSEGGRNVYDISFDESSKLYFIDDKNRINSVDEESFFGQLIKENGTMLYFIPNYKFNIGDKVIYKGARVVKVTKRINAQGNAAYYVSDNDGMFFASQSLLKPYKSEPKTWKDLVDMEVRIEGYCRYGGESKFYENMIASDENSDLYSTVFQVNHVKAVSIIGHLIDYYGCWVPFGVEAATIDLDRKYGNITIYTKQKYTGGMLRFENAREAARFLKYNEDLVKDYLMLNNRSLS